MKRYWLGKILWIIFGSVLLIGSALRAADSTKSSSKPLPSWRATQVK